MTSKTRKKRTTAKKKSRSRAKSKKTRIWLKPFLLVSGVMLFVFLSYLGYLDYTVRKQFEGKRWALPAKVFAIPMELYASYELNADRFIELLQRLNYRQDYRLSSSGTYFKKGGQVNIKTRRFAFTDRQADSHRYRLSFSGQAVTRIVDLDNSRDTAIIRLDPEQIGSFYPTRKEDRVLIKLENTPDALVHGLLATEDRDYYRHFGISFRGIARAMWANIQAGGIVQGGSTITQQLVKNFYLTSERSFWRKFNEALMALILEARYSKDEILEAYLNEVYLGQDRASAIHGFGLASEFYFGRPLQNLQLHQIATLVALVRGPTYYDPRRSGDRSVKRRNLVLDEMHGQGYISLKQSTESKRQALDVVAYRHKSVNRYPAFLDLVRRQLSQEYRDEDLTTEGLRVFTTLDTQVQNILEKTAAAKLKQLEQKPATSNLEVAATVTRRDSGEIVALMGSRKSSSSGFNRALDAVRPIGSLIKPVVYLTALENPDKYTINTRISDSQIQVQGENGKIWSPMNYDKKQHGEVYLRDALARSYNLATVRIGMDVGIARTAKTLRNLGVTRPINLYPSLLLGASPLTPLEVTQIYQTLAGEGFASPLRAIRSVISADGEPLQRYPFTVRQVVDPAATYITNTILQDVMTEGTGKAVYSVMSKGLRLAGKTGTTNKLRDSWFAGFSGDYLSVVWVGRDDNKPTGLTGSSGALPVWSSLMRQITSQPVALSKPDNVELVWIDTETGLRANQYCQNARQFPYVTGSAPNRVSPCVDTTGNRTRSWLNGILESFN